MWAFPSANSLKGFTMTNANTFAPIANVADPVLFPAHHMPAPVVAPAAPVKAAAANVMTSIVADATTVAKGKVENYSPEVTDCLLSAYRSGKTVEELAAAFGKTTRSIVAKLSREKVYVKKVYVTKAGVTPVSKEQHVSTIAAFMGVDVSKLESLEKANKTVLTLIEDTLKAMAHNFDTVK